MHGHVCRNKMVLNGYQATCGDPADTSFLTLLAEKSPPNCIKFRACSRNEMLHNITKQQNIYSR